MKVVYAVQIEVLTETGPRWVTPVLQDASIRATEMCTPLWRDPEQCAQFIKKLGLDPAHTNYRIREVPVQ